MCAACRARPAFPPRRRARPPPSTHPPRPRLFPPPLALSLFLSRTHCLPSPVPSLSHAQVAYAGPAPSKPLCVLHVRLSNTEHDNEGKLVNQAGQVCALAHLAGLLPGGISTFLFNVQVASTTHTPEGAALGTLMERVRALLEAPPPGPPPPSGFLLVSASPDRVDRRLQGLLEKVFQIAAGGGTWLSGGPDGRLLLLMPGQFRARDHSRVAADSVARSKACRARLACLKPGSPPASEPAAGQPCDLAAPEAVPGDVTDDDESCAGELLADSYAAIGVERSGADAAAAAAARAPVAGGHGPGPALTGCGGTGPAGGELVPGGGDVDMDVDAAGGDGAGGVAAPVIKAELATPAARAAPAAPAAAEPGHITRTMCLALEAVQQGPSPDVHDLGGLIEHPAMAALLDAPLAAAGLGVAVVLDYTVTLAAWGASITHDLRPGGDLVAAAALLVEARAVCSARTKVVDALQGAAAVVGAGTPGVSLPPGLEAGCAVLDIAVNGTLCAEVERQIACRTTLGEAGLAALATAEHDHARSALAKVADQPGNARAGAVHGLVSAAPTLDASSLLDSDWLLSAKVALDNLMRAGRRRPLRRRACCTQRRRSLWRPSPSLWAPFSTR